VIVLVLCQSSAVAGDKGDRPAIVRADVSVSDGLIVSDLFSSNLFTDQVVGTVESGLPAVVELLYKLVTRENKTVTRGLHAFELHYDVWEDFYSIVGMDSTVRFATFDRMAAAIEHLREIEIVPVSIVNTNTEYAVEFSIAVHPLRGREQQIVGWVGENVRSASDETWREQVLNLNDLIEHFFASGKGASGRNERSEWYRTGFFSPGRLPVDASSGGGGNAAPSRRRGGAARSKWHDGGAAAPSAIRWFGPHSDTAEEN
jgi:hypothetical protein